MVRLTQVREVLKTEQLEIQTKIAANAETLKLFQERKRLDTHLDKVYEITRKLRQYKPTRRLTKEMFNDIKDYSSVFILDNYIGYVISKILIKIDRVHNYIGREFIQMNGWYPNEVTLFLRYRHLVKVLEKMEKQPGNFLAQMTDVQRVNCFGRLLTEDKWSIKNKSFVDLEFYKTIKTEFGNLIKTPDIKQKHLEYFFRNISGTDFDEEDSIEVSLVKTLIDNLDKGSEYLNLAFESWINKTEHDIQDFLLSKPLLKELHEEWKSLTDFLVKGIDLQDIQENIAQLKADIITESTNR